ncbi:HypC/HybG/HupF family hydrogenase formation chaperone [Candidatus Woesearchaeota archaeon]|nr:HypC/HybG/HupF family hydrogenase formation chaperone [Candidatus Woesearchaeota archaeon]
MCLAVPGKVVGIKDSKATVDYISEKREGQILEGSYRKGDYVIIQGGIVIGKIPEAEAKKAIELFNSLN